MPRLKLIGATVVKMAPNVNNMDTRDMELLMNEEDFFASLDGVNPECIIKYLDIRHIPHRDAMQINLFEGKGIDAKRNMDKVLRMAADYNELLKKYYELKAQLEDVDR